jgi:ornithine cyclodeaminase/alanine dehydrogenase-like protein (mu-crystallin family)
MSALPFLDEKTLRELMPWPAAIDALAAYLRAASAGSGVPRVSVPMAAGELLLMSAESAEAVGVKVLGVAPGNPAAGRPRIQGLYVLFDAATLSPWLLIDGTALTAVRTPAVSALAAAHLAAPQASRLVVFGAGPQARGHVEALASIRPLEQVVVVARNPGRGNDFASELVGDGYPAVAGTPEAVCDADLVVCATTSAQPVFDGRRLAAHACVLAVGSHERGVRELDDVVFERADRVVVEDRDTALREAGDVIAAIEAGVCAPDALITLPEALDLSPQQGISIFKSVGMGWQDLAVAQAAGQRWRRQVGASQGTGAAS